MRYTIIINMNSIKNLKHKNLLIIGLILFVFLFLPASNAHAEGWLGGLISVGNFATDAIAKVLYYIALVFSSIGGLVFVLAAYLTSFALSLNLNILGPTNTLVSTGWIITRDLANLGFVLVIIVIAFSTILRLREYGNQKMLFKLIAAAILVNFSSAIAGVFIDFSNTITYFFLNKITDNPVGIATALAGAFNPQTFFGTPNFDGQDVSDVFSVILTGIQSLVFITVFTLAGAFSLLAVAVMFFLRYLHLTFLIIIAPVVWLFWVTPQLSGQFNKWWSSFFKWVFFGPASMFFIYLAVASAQGMSMQAQNYNDGSGFFGSMGAVIKDVLEKGAQMVVLIGVLLGGLMIAEQMGIEGAKGAVKGAKLIATGSAKGMGKFLGRTTGTGARLAGGVAARVPVIGPATRGLAGRLQTFAGTPSTTGIGKGLRRAAGAVGGALSGTTPIMGKGGLLREAGLKNPGSLISSLSSTMKKGVWAGLGLKDEKDKKLKTKQEFEKAISELEEKIENEKDEGKKEELEEKLEELEEGFEKFENRQGRRTTKREPTRTSPPPPEGFTTNSPPGTEPTTQPPTTPTT